MWVLLVDGGKVGVGEVAGVMIGGVQRTINYNGASGVWRDEQQIRWERKNLLSAKGEPCWVWEAERGCDGGVGMEGLHDG